MSSDHFPSPHTVRQSRVEGRARNVIPRRPRMGWVPDPRWSLRAQPGRRLARPATARLDRNLVARSEDLNEVPVRIGEGLVEGARERFPEARLVTEAIDEMPDEVAVHVDI